MPPPPMTSVTCLWLALNNLQRAAARLSLKWMPELRTQPARKRGSKKGSQQRQSEEEESAEPRIGDTQETLAADEPRAPSPKRKRVGKTAITLGPVSSEGTGAALKKKRKLNLKRIQTILGGNRQAKAAPSRPAGRDSEQPTGTQILGTEDPIKTARSRIIAAGAHTGLHVPHQRAL
ncbi:hypothetical protein DL89DRAFT_84392 [Linderina pennispora]|uniref:Ribosome biogenesis protein SLX9 n=1 Tax=Linderina pennispora TaxID=61395 RepID=A0A1Y1WIG3_9FUNG|nr:uncharacterized protein DL89DRAFT_84392 [Linderina pennispora]ORX72904.1 hypothetical protein DL89DRAFT_84392 [Linderina pennispora]